MSDLELEKVGRDPDALTEWAHAAFQNEMKKRGLQWDPVRRGAKPISEDEILIAVGTFPTRGEAALARDFLAEKGIKVYFFQARVQQDETAGKPPSAEVTQLLARTKDAPTVRILFAERDQMEAQRREDSRESPGLDKPVILRRYRDLPEAFVEKSVLDNAGILCFLQDDNVVRMDWFWSNAMGGIKLIVRAQDLEEADKILQQVRVPTQDPSSPGSQ